VVMLSTVSVGVYDSRSLVVENVIHGSTNLSPHTLYYKVFKSLFLVTRHSSLYPRSALVLGKMPSIEKFGNRETVSTRRRSYSGRFHATELPQWRVRMAGSGEVL
jgi:hypothetical protein